MVEIIGGIERMANDTISFLPELIGAIVILIIDPPSRIHGPVLEEVLVMRSEIGRLQEGGRRGGDPATGGSRRPGKKEGTRACPGYGPGRRRRQQADGGVGDCQRISKPCDPA